jgi:hypothetical protein
MTEWWTKDRSEAESTLLVLLGSPIGSFIPAKMVLLYRDCVHETIIYADEHRMIPKLGRIASGPAGRSW